MNTNFITKTNNANLPLINFRFKKTSNRGALKSQSNQRVTLLSKALRKHSCFRVINNGSKNRAAIFLYVMECEKWYWGYEFFGEVLNWVEFTNVEFFKNKY